MLDASAAAVREVVSVLDNLGAEDMDLVEWGSAAAPRSSAAPRPGGPRDRRVARRRGRQRGHVRSRRDVLEREADRLGALAVRGDVTSPRDLRAARRADADAFGGVDVLVNNSGGPPRTSALDITDDAVE